MTETIKAVAPSSRGVVKTEGKSKTALQGAFTPEENAFYKLSKEDQLDKIEEAMEKRGVEPSAEAVDDELARILQKKTDVASAIGVLERNYNEGYFLISALEDLVAHNQKNSYGKYFTSLRSESSMSPQNLFNKFSGIEDFNTITPMQVSLLTPYMRFSLLRQDRRNLGVNISEVEIPFQGGYLDANSSMLDPFARGQVGKGNIGIKQFQWDLRGKDPAYQGNITAKLTIFCDTLSLLDQEPYRTIFARSQTGVEIKAVVGWSASTGAKELLGERLYNAVKQARATLVMNMVQFEFNFEQDGSFDLVIDYVGRIDNFTKSFDLLSVHRDQVVRRASAVSALNTLSNSPLATKGLPVSGPINETPLDVKAQEFGLENFEELKMANPELAMQLEENTAAQIIIEATENLNQQDQLNVTDELQGKLKDALNAGNPEKFLEEEVIASIDRETAQRRQENMSRVQRMLNNFGKDESRIRILKVDKAAYEKYKRSIENRASASQMNKKIREENSKLAIVEKGVNESQRSNDPRASDAAKIKQDQEKLNGEVGNGEDKGSKGPKQKPKDLVVVPDIAASPTGVSISAGEILSEITYDSQDAANSHYISFFYLGDLIEVLYKIAEESNKSEEMPYMILGSFSFNNLFKGTSQMIEMVDIPITVGRYNAWFHKNYVAKKRSSIPLSDFLNDLIRTLIRPVFTGEAFYESPASGNPNVVKMVAGEMSSRRFSPKILGRQNLTSLVSEDSGLFHYPGNGKPKPYLLISSDINKPVTSGGNKAKDAAKGIAHYYMGQDSGLIHNVSFQMEPIKGLRESAIVSAAKGSSVDIARQPYQVGISALGNTIFTLGSRFYLLPTLPGRGAASTAGRLGLGGYYIVNSISNTISPGRFDTTIQAKQESMAVYNTNGALSSEKADSSTNSLTQEKAK